MATNLVPASSSFTTANMKPDAGDDGDEVWGQNAAENTGFNYLGTSNKPNICYGTKTLSYTGGASGGSGPPNTIDFGTDKTDGVSDFASTNYTIVFTAREPIPAATHPINIYVSAKTTGDCTVKVESFAGSGAQTIDVDWVAFGN